MRNERIPGMLAILNGIVLPEVKLKFSPDDHMHRFVEFFTQIT